MILLRRFIYCLYLFQAVDCLAVCFDLDYHDLFKKPVCPTFTEDSYLSPSQLQQLGAMKPTYLGSFPSKEALLEKLGLTKSEKLGAGAHGTTYVLCAGEGAESCRYVGKFYHGFIFYEIFRYFLPHLLAGPVTGTIPKALILQNKAAAIGAALPILAFGFFDSSSRLFIMEPRAEGDSRHCLSQTGATRLELVQLMTDAHIYHGDYRKDNLVVYNGRLYFIDFDFAELLSPHLIKSKIKYNYLDECYIE
ncbi:MAG: hypothetical protein KA436_12450 [Oligoflexales bacterium]|nr:hypothetical protein [Oligoflexales bacterium]